MRALALCGLAVAFTCAGASARPAPVTVLVWAPVDPAAQNIVIAPPVWAGIVDKYADAEHIVNAAAEPTIDACRAAHALYYLKAPFALIGDIAHSIRQDGRIMARTHVLAVNCVTQAPVFDRTVDLLSAPPSSGGDLESSPEGAWNTSAAAALARYPLPFADVSRIVAVHPPLAYVELSQTPANPDGAFRLFAHADGTPVSPAPVMPIVEASSKRIALLILQTQAEPHVGDYVERVTTVTP